MELLIFGILAVIALAGAAGVVLLRNPVHCAVCLLATFFAVAGMFGVLWAEFLAVVQLLVYTGGIMVLFLFVIMLVDGTLRIHDGQKATDVPLVQGQSYMRQAGIQHDVMNGSPHPIAFVEIEVKQPTALKLMPTT